MHPHAVQGYRKWKYAQKIYWANCLPSDSSGLDIHVICPIVRFFLQLGLQMFRQFCVQHTNAMVGHLSDKVLSNGPIFGQCCVQQSNGYAVSNCRSVVSWMSNTWSFKHLVGVFSITGKPLCIIKEWSFRCLLSILYPAIHLFVQSTPKDSALLSSILTLLAYPNLNI